MAGEDESGGAPAAVQAEAGTSLRPNLTLEEFLGMDEPQREAELTKSQLKKFRRLEEAHKKKQAKALAQNGADGAQGSAGAAGDPQKKEKKEKKAKAAAAALQDTTYVNTTPQGDFKHLTEEMAAGYYPNAVESAWYDWWEAQGYFQADPKVAKAAGQENRFVMVIPPPNVTGSLHLGHTLMCAIEDTMARWHRMHGRPVMWLPGVDHAGIATQVVVEKQLMRESQKSRHDLGRDAFVEQVWKWKELYGGKITNQLRCLGSSCDWTREEFTLSDKLSKAVREAFVRLYDDGLIYRDRRLVNWCVTLRTALSDIEVDYVDVPGRTLMKIPGYSEPVEFGVLTKFCYKLEKPEPGSIQELVIATTRLETMLGDTAVAVHPDDERYKHLIGQHVLHPFVDRKIPIIGDRELVDMSFGTGVVKVTPAHDPNDFLCGQRHKLPEVNIFTDTGELNEHCGPKFSGMQRYAARKALEVELEKIGCARGKEENAMRLGVCSRSGDVVEPMLKPQWWVNCKEMGAAAAQAARSGELDIQPEIFRDTWYAWLDNIKDWCISRQLWWGHRIPAYKIVGVPDLEDDLWVVGRDEREAHERAVKTLGRDDVTFELVQDEDVLDTWFSSGLFPFSVFGWPDMDSEDLQAFYPTNMLETGHDILFFWVARMVMLGMKLTGTLPFKTVYLHAMVRDKNGRKMSKSLGNIIDPLEVISGCSLDQLLEKVKQGSNQDPKELKIALQAQKADFPDGIPECGADALRFGLLAYTLQPRNMNLDVQRVISYRHFCNKLWNATKFALSNLGSAFVYSEDGLRSAIAAGSANDLFILSKLETTVCDVDTMFKAYNYASAVAATYNFWLYELCDIYLESIKPAMLGELGTDAQQHSRHVLYHCLHVGLRLLHPMMPFVTEELFQRLPNRLQHEPLVKSIMIAPYPLPGELASLAEKSNTDSTLQDAARAFEQAMKVVKAIRTLRNAYGLARNVKPAMYIVCRDSGVLGDIVWCARPIKTLCMSEQVTPLDVGRSGDVPVGCAASVVDDNCEVAIALTGIVDFETEVKKLEASALEKSLLLESDKQKTQAPDYETKVPQHVREKTQTRIEKTEQEIAAIRELQDKFCALLRK
ncbi:Valine--tRNA ligase [Porphyridium purpureum]|uniref:Valine--tRNA ligase, mitochondrial n=1 Tax=Porphyridium purpureum TaxID=35688 RepID=A0A5J4YUZ1_PORPP|nr:Valine--tRNA ligase [Porphyridium purpureum]|eukprot:POR9693..scf227_4